MRGYFGIGVYNPKTEVNIGTLWRSAFNMNAAFIFTIGKRYEEQASDTTKTPRHIPMYHYANLEDFQEHRPYDCLLIGVEQVDNAIELGVWCHPSRCIYLLGAEDNGLPPKVLELCQQVVQIETPMSLNVAVAGSIVMYARSQSRERPWATRPVENMKVRS